MVKFFVIGSMAPDFVYFIMFFYLLLKNLLMNWFGLEKAAFSLRGAVHGLFDEPVTIVLRQGGHSLFIWTVAFIIIAIGSRTLWVNGWLAFCYGWLGHILIDLLTHVQDAVPVFYPVSDLIFRGPVSYYDRDFFGREFSMINSVLIAAAILYLLIEKIRTKRRLKKSSYTAGQ
nr:zinc dependent phospholipase C family protein [Metabacillus mangrovi]